MESPREDSAAASYPARRSVRSIGAMTDVEVVFVDADDTLWENTRSFQHVLEAWGDLMEGFGCGRERALAVLEACEDRNIPVTGYGAAPFVASVLEASRELLPRAPAGSFGPLHAFCRRAEATIRDHPIELLPGVAEGLARLAERGPVVVLTKGQPDEQRAKVERSGLRAYLAGTRVVAEKTPEVYADAARSVDRAPGRCWMVGNSPRSDVNPARRAGFRTVLVPHRAPWHRELEALVEVGHPTRLATTFADVPGLIASRDSD